MTETTEQPVSLGVDQLEPAPENLRRKARDGQAFKQLVDSVRARGVLEPLLVTPNGGANFLIVAGHRRWEAAKEAGLKSVPVAVREMTESERTEVMLIENLQRSDLTPTEEAVGYLRLVDLGMSKKDLAKRIGRSANHVSDRIRLLDLPEKVQRLVDSGEVSIHGAAELLKLESREEMLQVVESKPYDYVSAVAQRVRQREFDAKVAKARELAASSGYEVLEYEYSIPGNVKVTALGSSYGDLPVDGKKHRGEPCHALAILTHGGKVLEVCTDPKRHAAKGPSELKVPAGAKAGRALSDREKNERAEAKAKAERTKARKVASAELLKRKLPADTAQMALKAFVLDANQTQLRAVCKLLDVEVVEKEYGFSAAEKELAGYMDGPAKTTKAAAALALVLLDETYEKSALAAHMKGWLAAQGITE